MMYKSYSVAMFVVSVVRAASNEKSESTPPLSLEFFEPSSFTLPRCNFGLSSGEVARFNERRNMAESSSEERGLYCDDHVTGPYEFQPSEGEAVTSQEPERPSRSRSLSLMRDYRREEMPYLIKAAIDVAAQRFGSHPEAEDVLGVLVLLRDSLQAKAEYPPSFVSDASTIFFYIVQALGRYKAMSPEMLDFEIPATERRILEECEFHRKIPYMFDMATARKVSLLRQEGTGPREWDRLKGVYDESNIQALLEATMERLVTSSRSPLLTCALRSDVEQALAVARRLLKRASLFFFSQISPSFSYPHPAPPSLLQDADAVTSYCLVKILRLQEMSRETLQDEIRSRELSPLDMRDDRGKPRKADAILRDVLDKFAALALKQEVQEQEKKTKTKSSKK